jgi:pimeloyl-ACP methyl ester carboxylesterase
MHSQWIGPIFMILTLLAGVQVRAAAQVWTVLTADAMGDSSSPSAVDAAQISYRYNKDDDILWFRITLYSKLNDQAFTVNIGFDTGGSEAEKVSWCGANSAFKFDRLLTASVRRRNNSYEGTIGISDAAGVKAKQFTNLAQNNLQLKVEGDSILIGVKRSSITDKLKMDLVAGVGENQVITDDLPNFGTAKLDLIAERPKQGLREIDLSRNNFEFPAGWKTLPDAKAPAVKKQGRGKQKLILIPGMYSGVAALDGFIARNSSRYTMYVLTPPGIGGTLPRPVSGTGPGLTEMVWTRLLERDILNLIDKEKIDGAVIVAAGNPGSQAAVELAIEQPEKIGGVVLAGNNLVQFFPSRKDPTRKTSVTAEERAILINEGWAAKWFKYVTAETWDSNDISPAMLSSDPARGERAWKEIEAAPLEVKIRYLLEFWGSDVARSFAKLKTPVLALVPAFDQAFLAEPANAFAKIAFIDSWETAIPKNPNFEIVKVPNARLLLLDDQPSESDAAIANFINRVTSKR